MKRDYIDEGGGNYYVAGTRISLDSVVDAFRRGDSPETICQNLELLSLEEVYGAIAYYLANQSAIDAYLNRQSEKWVEGRRSADPLPTGLRERVVRARDELRALLRVEEVDRFSAAVREGVVQADRGELIEDDEVRLWLEQQERT